MRGPTRSKSRGRLPWAGSEWATNTPDRSAGIMAMGCQDRKTNATREALGRGCGERSTRYPRELGWAAQAGYQNFLVQSASPHFTCIKLCVPVRVLLESALVHLPALDDVAEHFRQAACAP